MKLRKTFKKSENTKNKKPKNNKKEKAKRSTISEKSKMSVRSVRSVDPSGMHVDLTHVKNTKEKNEKFLTVIPSDAEEMSGDILESEVSEENITSENITSEDITSEDIPSNVPSVSPVAREREFALIQSQIDAFVSMRMGSILYISGVPGSGKTHTVEQALCKYNTRINNNNTRTNRDTNTRTNNNNTRINNNTSSSNIHTHYVNCAALSSKSQIYKHILRSFSASGCSVDLHGNLQSLRAHLFSDCDVMHILVIDEIDMLMNRNETVLYNLFELPYINHRSTNRLMLILLSNTLGKLSSKVESRIGRNRIEFKPYTAHQIQEIITSKTNKEGDLTSGKNILTSGNNILTSGENKSTDLVSLFVAKKVASGSGDFRKAWDIIANNPADIKEANQTIREYYTPLIGRFYKELNEYQQIVISIISNNTSRDISNNTRDTYCNNTDTSNSYDCLRLFDDFKRECRILSINTLKYFDYLDVIEDLRDYGFIKIRGREIIREYLPEEI